MREKQKGAGWGMIWVVSFITACVAFASKK